MTVWTDINPSAVVSALIAAHVFNATTLWGKPIGSDEFAQMGRNMVSVPGREFAICKYEVTQGLWRAVMGNNPSTHKDDNLPVDNVSWNDCQRFISKLNEMPEFKEPGFTYRLPTADEWEYACRAGAKGDYCKLADGKEITRETLGEVAWFNDNSGSNLHPVGQKTPNAFGLYDMHGNVWEWTSTQEDVHPILGGVRHYRILCGGCYNHFAFVCEAGKKSSASPDSRCPGFGGSYGLRLAADKAVH